MNYVTSGGNKMVMLTLKNLPVFAERFLKCVTTLRTFGRKDLPDNL